MAARRWGGWREGPRQSLPVYVALANTNEASRLSSSNLLLLAAGPLSLPLLLGIDRVPISSTFCLLRHDHLLDSAQTPFFSNSILFFDSSIYSSEMMHQLGMFTSKSNL